MSAPFINPKPYVLRGDRVDGVGASEGALNWTPETPDMTFGPGGKPRSVWSRVVEALRLSRRSGG